jgi:hypothetical protein
MKVRSLTAVWTLLVGCALMPAPAAAAWDFELEPGAVFTGSNRFRVPNRTATRPGDFISFTEDLRTETGLSLRARATCTWCQRHHVSTLAAPLRLEAQGVFYSPTWFGDSIFLPWTVDTVRGTYRFDTYRATYRYDLARTSRVRFGLGLTALVRSAAITLEQEQSRGLLRVTEDNLGIVPLVSFRLDWYFARPVALRLEGDALVAPPFGRAEDVLLALQAEPVRRLNLYAGYRVLEGGGDSPRVYSFALLHYAVLGIGLRF